MGFHNKPGKWLILDEKTHHIKTIENRENRMTSYNRGQMPARICFKPYRFSCTGDLLLYPPHWIRDPCIYPLSICTSYLIICLSYFFLYSFFKSHKSSRIFYKYMKVENMFWNLILQHMDIWWRVASDIDTDISAIVVYFFRYTGIRVVSLLTHWYMVQCGSIC